jgi:small subunit ribosomal protein S13
MPRISGIDIPNGKPIYISLTYLFGIGRTLSIKILRELGVDLMKLAKDLNEDEVSRIASHLDREYTVEGQLRRKIGQDIGRLREINCYRGLRHKKSLPVRGQRTRTNARTRKGVRKTVAGKKGVKDLR